MSVDLEERPAPADRPRMDPRFRARRAAVRRGEGRRRLRRVAILASLLGVALVGYGATRSPLLDVDRVTVAGATHTPADAVIAASGIRSGDAMTDLDIAGAREAIESLPWVETAVVKRRWPSTVRIGIVERTAVAFVLADDGRFALVDDEGQVLEVVDAGPIGMLAIADLVAPDEPGARVPASFGDVLEVATAMPATLRQRVVGVAPTAGADGEVELRLNDGAVARLGRPDQLDAKLVAVATVLEQVDRSCMRVLDVRVASSPVITRAC